MNRLIDTLTIADRGGVDVPLILTGYRRVDSATGLAGMATRQVITTATGMHGARNRTRYRDARTVAVTGTLTGDGDANRAWLEYDTVARALSGAVDTDRLLKWTAGGRALQASVRLVSIEPAIQIGPDILRYQAIFQAGDPRGYATTETTVVATSLSAGGGGLIFPDPFPWTFDPASGGLAAIDNTGTVDTPGTYILTGTLVNPVLTLSTGATMVFVGTISTGEQLYVHTSPEHTVLLNDVSNRINLVSFATTTWFELPPGASLVRLTALSFSGAAGLQVRYRPAYE